MNGRAHSTIEVVDTKISNYTKSTAPKRRHGGLGHDTINRGSDDDRGCNEIFCMHCVVVSVL